MKRFWLAVWLVLLASTAAAQTVVGDRFQLRTGPCTHRSGSGSPEGVTTGKVCDTYLDTATGVFYEKWTGTGNTGWNVGHNANARINGNLDTTGFLEVPGYVSQTTGWKLTAAGALDVRYLYTDELRAKLFTADLESVLAGSQRITKSFSTISQTFTCPASASTSTLWVFDAPTFGDAAVFVSGDAVLIHSMTRTVFGPFTITDCVGVVTSYADGTGGNAGQQSWTFTRNTGVPGNGGTMTASTTVAVNNLVQDMGVTGNGYIEATAVDGAGGINAPYTQTVSWTTAPVAANLTVTTRMGRLTGLTGDAAEYGFLGGKLVGSTASEYIKASNNGLLLNNTDIKMYNSGTEVIRMDHSVPSLAIGSAVPTAYGTGTGIWMGNDAGTYKFRVGTPNGYGMFWNGSTLDIVGDVNIRAGGTDNVIKSGAFEGPTQTEAFLGWNVFSSSGTAPIQACCSGIDGPSTMYHNPGNGQQSYGDYRAIPVTPGQAFRVAAWTIVNTTTTAGVVVSVQESTSTSAGVTHVDGPAGTGVVSSTSSTSLYSAGQTSGSWLAREFAYTVPAGVHWISLLIGDQSGSIVGSTYTDVHFDNVQMQTQLGSGHLQVGSINADRIVAGSITASQIAAGTITATQIAANTITAGQIAAGTITATEIAANTITASKLNVSTLSAITADLGSVTAGQIAIGSGGNTMWFNDGGDNQLVIGGGTKASAPFIVTATGALLISTFAITAQAGINVSGAVITAGGGIFHPAFSGNGTRVVCVDNGGFYILGASNTGC